MGAAYRGMSAFDFNFKNNGRDACVGETPAAWIMAVIEHPFPNLLSPDVTQKTVQEVSEAISMTKRYFTSLFSKRS